MFTESHCKYNLVFTQPIASNSLMSIGYPVSSPFIFINEWQEAMVWIRRLSVGNRAGWGSLSYTINVFFLSKDLRVFLFLPGTGFPWFHKPRPGLDPLLWEYLSKYINKAFIRFLGGTKGIEERRKLSQCLTGNLIFFVGFKSSVSCTSCSLYN